MTKIIILSFIRHALYYLYFITDTSSILADSKPGHTPEIRQKN